MTGIQEGGQTHELKIVLDSTDGSSLPVRRFLYDCICILCKQCNESFLGSDTRCLHCTQPESTFKASIVAWDKRRNSRLTAE